MLNGININYGNLSMSLPSINTAPLIAAPISGALASVTASAANAETMGNGQGAGKSYQLATALMQNNANYQGLQAQSNQAFNNQAVQVAQYQANAISNQGKGK